MTIAKPITTLPDATRFWSFVNIGEPDDCWKWNRKGRNNGYGFLTLPDGLFPSHRLAYALSKGIPEPADVICHTCDTPPCCNPDHLYIGTHSTNAQDRENRNRRDTHHPSVLAALPRGDDHWSHITPSKVRRGEDCPQSPLTADLVREIRTRYAQGGVSQRALCKQYGVTGSSMHSIILRKTWQHTDDIQPPENRRSTGGTEGQRSQLVYHRAKLTPVQVQQIRHMYKSGVKQTRLAQEFGIAQAQISNIVLRKTWPDVPDVE